jgi:hypothetical protein
VGWEWGGAGREEVGGGREGGGGKTGIALITFVYMNLLNIEQLFFSNYQYKYNTKVYFFKFWFPKVTY